MEKNPLHFFRIQKTDRYVRVKIGQLNIYFSWHPLRTRPKNKDTGARKTKRKKLKKMLLDAGNRDGYCALCGKHVTWETASVHHIVPRSQNPSREFDITNLQLLCCDCHLRLHQIEALQAKKQRVC